MCHGCIWITVFPKCTMNLAGIVMISDDYGAHTHALTHSRVHTHSRIYLLILAMTLRQAQVSAILNIQNLRSIFGYTICMCAIKFNVLLRSPILLRSVLRFFFCLLVRSLNCIQKGFSITTLIQTI